MKRLVYGVGINDVSYVVRSTKNGRAFHCPYYQTWARMLERCYSEKYQENKKAYQGCSVCIDWHTFSNFKSWMKNQNWEGKQLDKDLLVKGNKIYSPETCIFIDRLVNAFILNIKHDRRDLPVGVSFNKDKGKYQSGCSNPFTKGMDYLGYFDCANEAHKAWKNRKHEIACKLADLQADPRVAEALRTRYL